MSCFLSHDGVLSIRTNGKTDTAVMVRGGAQPTPDESTMILLAVLPMFSHSQAERAAAIGFGCGYTSRMLLANPALTAVDTIEIERMMVVGALHFSPMVDVVLTDGRAISYAESVLGYVADRRLGTIVGSPTAGTNGNVASFMTPGGFEARITGMLVTRHDGRSRHHLLGIQPDVPVEPKESSIKVWLFSTPALIDVRRL